MPFLTQKTDLEKKYNKPALSRMKNPVAYEGKQRESRKRRRKWRIVSFFPAILG